MGQSLSSLPPEQRAKVYRQFAYMAVRRAREATTEQVRSGHLSMAAGWHALAVEVEHLMDRFESRGEEFEELLPAPASG